MCRYVLHMVCTWLHMVGGTYKRTHTPKGMYVGVLLSHPKSLKTRLLAKESAASRAQRIIDSECAVSVHTLTSTLDPIQASHVSHAHGQHARMQSASGVRGVQAGG